MSKELIDLKCEHCGHDKSYFSKTELFELGLCEKCGKKTYFKNLNKNPQPIVHCPYCNSFNTHKISTVSKIGSVAMWGVFAAGKVSKQWHCNACKSDF